MWGSGSKYLAPFEAFQDNGLQHVADEGNVTVRNGIIDGVKNTGLSVISSPGGTTVLDPVIYQNILINNTKYIGVYGGTSMQYGVNYEFRDLYFRESTNTYDFIGTPDVNYFISMNGTDKTSFIGNTFDDSKANTFQDSTGIETFGTRIDNGMDAPAYRVTPFKGFTAENYSMYFQTFGSAVPNTGTAVPYTTNNIVAEWIAGTSYKFYKCILNHTSSGATHPGADPTHWELITFDEDGDPSYHADWDAGDAQTDYPWDDLRLEADSEWNLKGIGLRGNERNTNYTTFQWFVDDNGDDTGNLELSGETDPTNFERQSEDVGRWVRCKAHIKLAGGSFVDEWVNSWTLVN